MASNGDLHVLGLPEEILETIFSYLSYHETSEARGVCKIFNKHCQQKLNKGFARVDKLHAHIQKDVKNKLPRRESERRNHQLARHVDILSAVETRLSLLGMSYTKYMENGLCCFIPGKVLDELFSILLKLQSCEQPPRSHEFLQELRDISSMAMEHFDEKIAPGLKNKLPVVTLSYPFPDACGSVSPALLPSRGPSLRSEVNNLRLQVNASLTNAQQTRRDVSEIKVGHFSVKRKMVEQDKKIVQQGQTIVELEKKVNDLNQKFVDLSAELQKLKEARDGPEASCSAVHKVDKKGDNKRDTNLQTKTLKRKPTATYEARVKRSRN